MSEEVKKPLEDEAMASDNKEATAEEREATATDTAADDAAEKAAEEGGAESDSEQPEEGEDKDAAANSGEGESEEDEAYKDRYLRLLADFQNFKRRIEKERSDVHAFANEKIVTDLLEVLDNFDRALSTEEQEGFKEGMELIFGQLKDVLTHAGMQEIEAEAVLFDPNIHNAVLMEETDKVESGFVSEVLQKGYTLNGKVIRPSMVKVAK